MHFSSLTEFIMYCQDDEPLPLSKACEILKVKRRRMYEILESNDLVYYQWNSQYIFKRGDVLEYAKHRNTKRGRHAKAKG